MQKQQRKVIKQNKKSLNFNDRENFISALYESTSEVIKPLTKKQDESLTDEHNIVKQISDLLKSLKAMRYYPKANARTECPKEIKEQNNKRKQRKKKQK